MKEKEIRQAINEALDTVKRIAQQIDDLKISVMLLKLLLGAQFGARDADSLGVFLKELAQVEKQLRASEREDTELMFEALKHLIAKGSWEPEA